MLNKVFCFHQCKTTTQAILMSSAAPNGACVQATSLTQYITHVVIIALGNTCAINCKRGGNTS